MNAVLKSTEMDAYAMCMFVNRIVESMVPHDVKIKDELVKLLFDVFLNAFCKKNHKDAVFTSFDNTTIKFTVLEHLAVIRMQSCTPRFLAKLE